MKKFLSILSLLALLIAVNLPTAFAGQPAKAKTTAAKPTEPAAEKPTTTTTTTPPVQPAPVVPEDTVGTVKEIDGELFIIVAQDVDETTGQVVTIIKAYKENEANGGSTLEFILNLVMSGGLGLLLTQFGKTSKGIKQVFGAIERPVRMAFYISGAIAAGWIGIATGFKYTDFTFVELATKWLLTFGPTLLIYEYLGRKVFKQTQPAPATA